MLSLINLVMRGIAVSFNSYINRKIGAESMGLFTLVMSVYGFAVTIALSCVNLGAVRLTSERCAVLEGTDKVSWKYAMRRVVQSVVIYSLIFGISSGVLLFSSSEIIAKYLLQDMRTVQSLKILAISLPAISLSSALSGYFTGLRKVSKNAVCAVSEQFIKIIITSTALVLISPNEVESACNAVVGGAALAEAWSLVLNIVFYLSDSGRPIGGKLGHIKKCLKTKFKDVAEISFPSAVGTYARQGLTTLEHLAIPRGLKRSGLTQEQALASYGLLQGISFPLVMFPYAVIGAFTSLLIPEVSERHAAGDKSGITHMTRLVYRSSALFSIAACGFFVNYSDTLGVLVYDSSDATVYTLLLGLLVPFMYLDTAVDSLLKGLGEQVYTMKVNIADAASGLFLVCLLTPVLGIYGYILTIWICEIMNLWASIRRLGKITGEGILSAAKCYVKPCLICGLLSVVRVIFMDNLPPILSMVVFTALYVMIAYIFVMGNERRFVSKKEHVVVSNG